LAVFRVLCREYAASLPEIGLSLEQQGFEQEMATLPGRYSTPGGAVLLARLNDSWAGCVALRPLEGPGVCEMKRMYVRPAARGHGIGHLLGQSVVDRARRLGYRTMRLDTDKNMAAAIAVYTRLGFKPCERYNSDPCPCTLWFELDLVRRAAL
jgi:putative acetyltransferase